MMVCLFACLFLMVLFITVFSCVKSWEGRQYQLLNGSRTCVRDGTQGFSLEHVICEMLA